MYHLLREFSKYRQLLQEADDTSRSLNRVLLGDHSVCDPPDPISNSEVKPDSADGRVGFPHVRVGHRQAFIP